MDVFARVWLIQKPNKQHSQLNWVSWCLSFVWGPCLTDHVNKGKLWACQPPGNGLDLASSILSFFPQKILNYSYSSRKIIIQPFKINHYIVYLLCKREQENEQQSVGCWDDWLSTRVPHIVQVYYYTISASCASFHSFCRF